MDSFAGSLTNKVTLMPDFSNKDRFTEQQNNLESAFDDLIAEEDLLMEQILENMNSTPIGQVLKQIASLPDARRQKILRVRRQLNEGRYDLNERLDLALEKVLDDLET
jgi:hypothetical protein